MLKAMSPLGYILTVLFLSGLCSAKELCPPKKPHIVFMIVDDLGFNDVSFHGSKQIPTPNIDAIAKDGVILNNYYVQPTCSPSRGSLMTGKYPIRIGFQHEVIIASSPWGLPLNETIIPQYLKSFDYSTHAVGKWHLGFYKKDYLPLKRGFDSFFGYYTGVEDYYDHFSIAYNYTGLDLHRDYDNAWNYNGTYGTELFTQKAKDVILRHNPTKPLFLYFAQQAPHSGNFINPIQVPEKYVTPLKGIPNEGRRKFAGMVSAMDYSVGEIFQTLDKAKMLDNTIFIFTTDNGGAVHDTDGSYGSNYPLRGSKYNLWEGGTRGVSFVWSPFLRRKSRISNEMMHLSDWLPTLLSAAGGPDAARSLKNIDGVDQWPTITRGVPSKRNEILLNIDPVSNISGIRKKNFKLVKGSYDGGKFDGWYDVNGLKIEGEMKPESKAQKFIYKQTYLKFLRQSKAARVLWRKYAKNPLLTVNCRRPECSTFPIAKCGWNIPHANNSCEPHKAPCLFDIVKDPCEFNNLAPKYPEVVKDLEAAMAKYVPLSVAPGDKPSDPAANPALHGNAWVSWE